MNDKLSELPKALIDLGQSRGFVSYSDIEEHIPDWDASEPSRELIIARLDAVGVAVYELPPATIGMLEVIGDPEQVSLAKLGTGPRVDGAVNCRFSFVCDKKLNELQDTSDPSAGYCGDCKRPVLYCLSVEEAAEAIARKQCVALMFSHVLVQPE